MVAANPMIAEREEGLKEFQEILPVFQEAHIVIERFYNTAAHGSNKKDVAAHMDALKKQLSVAIKEQEELATQIRNGGIEPYNGPEPPLLEPTPAPRTETVSANQPTEEDAIIDQMIAHFDKFVAQVPTLQRIIETTRKEIEDICTKFDKLQSDIDLLQSKSTPIDTIIADHAALIAEANKVKSELDAESNQYFKKFIAEFTKGEVKLHQAYQTINGLLGKGLTVFEQKQLSEMQALATAVKDLIDLLDADKKEVEGLIQQLGTIGNLIQTIAKKPDVTNNQNLATTAANSTAMVKVLRTAANTGQPSAVRRLATSASNLRSQTQAVIAARRVARTKKEELLHLYNDMRTVIFNQTNILVKRSGVSDNAARVKRNKAITELRTFAAVETMRVPLKKVAADAEGLAKTAENVLKGVMPSERTVAKAEINIIEGAIQTLKRDFTREFKKL